MTIPTFVLTIYLPTGWAKALFLTIEWVVLKYLDYEMIRNDANSGIIVKEIPDTFVIFSRDNLKMEILRF